MRWFIYFIFAYVMLGIQTGADAFIRFHDASPNLALLVAIFIALNARRDRALLGCFAVGFFQDLLSGQPIGLYAFSYGILAMFITAAHQMMKKTHTLTHIALALIGGLITTFVLMLHSWIHPAGPAFVEGKLVFHANRIPLSTEMIRVLYTTAISPFVFIVMQRIRGLFVLQRTQRQMRW